MEMTSTLLTFCEGNPVDSPHKGALVWNFVFSSRYPEQDVKQTVELPWNSGDVILMPNPFYSQVRYVLNDFVDLGLGYTPLVIKSDGVGHTEGSGLREPCLLADIFRGNLGQDRLLFKAKDKTRKDDINNFI